VENVENCPFVENVKRGIFGQLGVDHGPNQFLDVALGFGLAFRELVQTNFAGFKARLDQCLDAAFAPDGELESMPGRRPYRCPPHVS